MLTFMVKSLQNIFLIKIMDAMYNKAIKASPIKSSLNRHRRVVFMCLLLIGFLWQSCYVERRLAHSFINTSKEISVLVLMPDVFLKTNLKAEIANPDTFASVAAKDAYSIAQSEFLKLIDLDEAYKVFYGALMQELKAYNINVYTAEDVDTFFTLSSPAYVFNIEQIEIEEYYKPLREEFERSAWDTVIYVQEFLLNAVNFNTWIEFSEINSEHPAQLLFSNFFISDEIDGTFFTDRQTREVKYRYYRHDMKEKDLWQLIRFAGKKNSTYIFNHILNLYVQENSPYTSPTGVFYDYNRNDGKVYMREDYKQFHIL